MVFQNHKPGSEDRCLEEGGQAQANDCLLYTSFTLFFQQVRPLVPVGKPQTMRHNGLTHANGPIRRLAFALMSFSEFLQLGEQCELFRSYIFHFHPPFSLLQLVILPSRCR